jgi:transposase InsO family protein
VAFGAFVVTAVWVIDSGASHHMCNARSSFVEFKKLHTPIRIRLGDDSAVCATHHGLVNITASFQVYALYTPTFKFSLLSISNLDDDGFLTKFGHGVCQISSGSTAHPTIQGTKRNGIYYLDDRQGVGLAAMLSEEVVPDPAINFEDDYAQDETIPKAPRERPLKRRRGTGNKPIPANPSAPPSRLSTAETRLWHRRLAHLHPAAMRSLIDGLTHDDAICEVCLKAKQKRKIVRIPVQPTTRPYELVHSDLCGPFSTPSLGGKRYYIIFVDDFSRYIEVFLLADKKAESCTGAFQQYQAQAKARGYDIKRFRCDNGKGEYDNTLFRSILRQSGISFEPSPPYAQHKNGVSERMIGAVTEKGRAMIIDSQAPYEFWGEAVMTAAYLHRRTPHRALNGKSPHEVLNGYNADRAPPPAPIHHLRRFGCRAFRHIPEEQRSDKKLGERSKQCMMVGYVHHTTKLWKVWDPEFKKVLHVSDVVFDEDVNCYVSCPTPTESLDPFGLPQQEPIHIEYVDMPTHDDSEVQHTPAAMTDNVIGEVEAGVTAVAAKAGNAVADNATGRDAGVTAVADKAGNAVADNATGRDAGEFPQWLKKPVAE